MRSHPTVPLPADTAQYSRALMKDRSRAVASRFCAGLFALVVTACTSPSSPGTLARAEQPNSGAAPVSPTAESLPPVTTAPPPTTAPTTSPATFSLRPETETSTTTEPPPPSNLELITDQLRKALGPTDDVGATIQAVAPFPVGLTTPENSDVKEISIGTGSPTDDGTALAQVSVTLTTSLDAAAAFDQMSSALLSSGTFMIDSTVQGDVRSAAFRLPGVGLFDEVVLTTRPHSVGSSVRITSNSDRTTDQLSLLVDWADEPLPLPTSDDQRTLVVMSASGTGRLRVVNLMVESTSVLESRSPQGEANRLISRVEGSDRFGYAGDPSIDQPLTGPLIFDGLDSLDYFVVPAVRTEVDEDGEPVESDVVEVRLVGLLELTG